MAAGKLGFLTVALVYFSMMSVGTVYGLDLQPLDSCIGIDHPPFERSYGGDGLSYLNVGLTLSPADGPADGSSTSVSGVLQDSAGHSIEVVAEADADGRAFLSFPLYGYGSYQVLVTDGQGRSLLDEAIAVGPGETPCSREQLALAATDSTTTNSTDGDSTTTNSTDGDSTTTDSIDGDSTVTDSTDGDNTATDSTATGEDAGAGGVGPVGVLVAVALVLAATIGGVMVGKAKKKGGPCEELRQAWVAATERLTEAKAAAVKAQAAAEAAANQRAGLEAELAGIRDSYPSAGQPGGDTSWVQSEGQRVTGRDVALRREAEQTAWAKYRENPNPETAAELEKAWQEAAAPASREERQEIDDRAHELDQRLSEARRAETETQQAAQKAQDEADAAAAAAAAAQRAYEECMNPAAPPAVGSAPGGPTVTAEPDDPRDADGCREDEPPQERNHRELGMVTFPFRHRLELMGGHAHKAAVEGKDIGDSLADVADTLGWLSTAMDITGIGTKLVSEGAGWAVIGESIAPVGSKVLGSPIPTSPGQALVDAMSLATNIASVIVAKVPELQARRLPDCNIKLTSYTRTLKATCTEIWVCRGGQWVFDRRRFALTVVREGSGGSYRDSALTWQQAQAAIAGYEVREMARVRRAVDRIMQFESACGG